MMEMQEEVMKQHLAHTFQVPAIVSIDKERADLLRSSNWSSSSKRGRASAYLMRNKPKVRKEKKNPFKKSDDHVNVLDRVYKRQKEQSLSPDKKNLKLLDKFSLKDLEDHDASMDH